MFRLMNQEELRDTALQSGYEDTEGSTAEEKLMDETHNTMVELQARAYQSMKETQGLTQSAFAVTTLAYSMFDSDRIMQILNEICDATEADDERREAFLDQARETLAERDDSIESRFGKSDGPLN